MPDEILFKIVVGTCQLSVDYLLKGRKMTSMILTENDNHVRFIPLVVSGWNLINLKINFLSVVIWICKVL